MTTHTQASTSPLGRSRITNGKELLPGVDGRSVWARLFRDQRAALIQHAGGEDHVSEPRRMLARRAAAIEAELVHLEASFAEARSRGAAPESAAVDLYSRLSNNQRRLLEGLGLDPTAKEVTPSLHSYLSATEGQR